MKNIKSSKIVFLVLAVGIFLTGTVACKKLLDVEPISEFDNRFVFSDVPNATIAVMGAYAPLSGADTYGKVLSLYFPYDSDEGNVSGNPDAGRRGIGKYAVTPTNIEIDGPWNELYKAIERANICIEQIPLMNLYNNGSASDQAALKRLHGEALTIRAQCYFELIRNWGDVPLHIIPSSKQSDLNLPKTNRDVIYDVLIEDLRVASDLVPWMGDVPRDERITKGAVKGLRAKIALFRAGYSLRKYGQMQQGSNRLAYMAIVSQECLDIINSGKHGLNGSYEDLFKKYVCGLTPDPAKEILFEVAHAGGNAADDSQLGFYLGTRAHANSTYGQGNRGVLTNGVYFYSFDSTDTRLNVTIGTYEILADNKKAFTKMNNALAIAKFRREWSPVPVPGSAQTLGYNWPLIRYSDILLMFAEAENELNNGPTPNAILAFEEVRTRAYAGDASKIGTTPSDYTGFFNAIMNERLLEFGGEGIRKYDLIRWNLLGTKLAYVKSTLTAMSNQAGIWVNYPLNIYWENVGNELKLNNSFYKPEPVAVPAGIKTEWLGSLDGSGVSSINAIGESYVPNTNDELLPIPQSAIISSPALTQDYGY